MLYETLSQPLVFVCIFAVGLISGFMFDLSHLFCALCNKNKILHQILYFICTILSAFCLFMVNLKVNYGRFRIFILATFFFGLLLERITIGKLWTKLVQKCYNINQRRKQKDEQGETG